ncbi:DNA repair protein RAD51 homolog 3-like [Apostichopus japonicus]|uniref:DNA repair protein RAD51 homolog 3-like n=1 Tax=Stichopus japonicus TaxID=307972 RepID=UPI003AB36157
MQRELGSFPLPPHLKKKLSSAGFSLVEDLHNVKPSELSKELSITTEEALEVLATISPSTQRAPVNSALSAFELLKRENDSPGIITFCEEVDDMLGGGVPLAKITEFCGSPGVGKTQLSIQLAVNVQIPEAFGGLQGEAVFIDTEGSFIPQRAADIAQAVEDHCRRVASIQRTELEDQSACLKDFSVEKILSGIHYFRCHNYTELLALVNLLPQFIKDHEKIKLIIIDSIAFHFRHDLDDMSLRTRLLNGLAQSLIKMATMYRLAVVLTNQMTTKVNTSQGGSSHLSPALGESWGHAATLRVILSWRNNQRFATLYKSPSKKEMTVPYQVTIAGIRSMEQEQNETATKNDASGSSGGVNPRKRRRAQSQENG